MARSFPQNTSLQKGKKVQQHFLNNKIFTFGDLDLLVRTANIL